MAICLRTLESLNACGVLTQPTKRSTWPRPRKVMVPQLRSEPGIAGIPTELESLSFRSTTTAWVIANRNELDDRHHGLGCAHPFGPSSSRPSAPPSSLALPTAPTATGITSDTPRGAVRLTGTTATHPTARVFESNPRRPNRKTCSAANAAGRHYRRRHRSNPTYTHHTPFVYLPANRFTRRTNVYVPISKIGARSYALYSGSANIEGFLEMSTLESAEPVHYCEPYENNVHP